MAEAGLDSGATASLETLAGDLHGRLVQMARSLRPFPGFMGLNTLQALEVEPDAPPGLERGCVVLCPDGEFYELTLRLIPGPFGVEGTDYVDELRRLDFSPSEFVAYARAAIGELERLLGRPS